MEHVRGAGGWRGLWGGDGEASGQRGAGRVGLRAVEQRRSGTVVLLVIATLALAVLTLWFRGAAASNRVVVIVVAAVAVSLSVVVGTGTSSTCTLLPVSLLPPWSVFIIGIVLNNKINISQAGSREGEER